MRSRALRAVMLNMLRNRPVQVSKSVGNVFGSAVRSLTTKKGLEVWCVIRGF